MAFRRLLSNSKRLFVSPKSPPPLESRDRTGIFLQISFGRQLTDDDDEPSNVTPLEKLSNEVTKSVDKLIDPKRRELEKLEIEKLKIDQKADSQAFGDYCCGMGYGTTQYMGLFMPNFDDLGWHQMGSICFFVAGQLYMMNLLMPSITWTASDGLYMESFVQRRFKVKQRKLMKIHKFDIEKYNQLRQIYYPNDDCNK